jgi:hypothetical protein
MQNKNKRTFFDLFDSRQPGLQVKFNINSDEKPTIVKIENKLVPKTDSKAKEFLSTISNEVNVQKFLDFYELYDGFELGTPIAPKNCIKKTSLRQLSAASINEFTKQYLPGGKWAWTIDLNKSKAIYRGEESWIAFAEIGEGPACLTIFIEGENAGNIFLLTPQPHFNILKPVAKSYTLLLDRIAKDPAAFFRMVRAYVTIEGNDGLNYGHLPISYIDDVGSLEQEEIRTPNIL